MLRSRASIFPYYRELDIRFEISCFPEPHFCKFPEQKLREAVQVEDLSFDWLKLFSGSLYLLVPIQEPGATFEVYLGYSELIRPQAATYLGQLENSIQGTVLSFGLYKIHIYCLLSDRPIPNMAANFNNGNTVRRMYLCPFSHRLFTSNVMLNRMRLTINILADIHHDPYSVEFNHITLNRTKSGCKRPPSCVSEMRRHHLESQQVKDFLLTSRIISLRVTPSRSTDQSVILPRYVSRGGVFMLTCLHYQTLVLY